MNIQTTKLQLIKLLVETEDIAILQQVINILKPQKMEPDIWGYDVKGLQITDKQMLQMLQEADDARKSGQLISQEALEIEAENW